MPARDGLWRSERLMFQGQAERVQPWERAEGTKQPAGQASASWRGLGSSVSQRRRLRPTCVPAGPNRHAVRPRTPADRRTGVPTGPLTQPMPKPTTPPTPGRGPSTTMLPVRIAETTRPIGKAPDRLAATMMRAMGPRAPNRPDRCTHRSRAAPPSLRTICMHRTPAIVPPWRRTARPSAWGTWESETHSAARSPESTDRSQPSVRPGPSPVRPVCRVDWGSSTVRPRPEGSGFFAPSFY